MPISISKESLLAKLRQQLKIAESDDAARTKKHRQDEQAALVNFRAKLREALKWEYAKAKKEDFSIGFNRYRNAPDCPKLSAPRFKELIKRVELDERKQPYSIHESTDLYEALMWQPASVRDKETPCD